MHQGHARGYSRGNGRGRGRDHQAQRGPRNAATTSNGMTHDGKFTYSDEGDLDIRKMTYKYTPKLKDQIQAHPEWTLATNTPNATLSVKNSSSFIKEYVDGLAYADKGVLQCMIGNEPYGIPGFVFTHGFDMSGNPQISYCSASLAKFIDMDWNEPISEVGFVKRAGLYILGGSSSVYVVSPFTLNKCMEVILSNSEPRSDWVAQVNADLATTDDGEGWQVKYDARVSVIVVRSKNMVSYNMIRLLVQRLGAIGDGEQTSEEGSLHGRYVTNMIIRKRRYGDKPTKLANFIRDFEEASFAESVKAVTKFVNSLGAICTGDSEQDGIYFTGLGIDVGITKRDGPKIVEINLGGDLIGNKYIHVDREDAGRLLYDIVNLLTDALKGKLGADYNNIKCIAVVDGSKTWQRYLFTDVRAEYYRTYEIAVHYALATSGVWAGIPPKFLSTSQWLRHENRAERKVEYCDDKRMSLIKSTPDFIDELYQMFTAPEDWKNARPVIAFCIGKGRDVYFFLCRLGRYSDAEWLRISVSIARVRNAYVALNPMNHVSAILMFWIDRTCAVIGVAKFEDVFASAPVKQAFPPVVNVQSIVYTQFGQMMQVLAASSPIEWKEHISGFVDNDFVSIAEERLRPAGDAADHYLINYRSRKIGDVRGDALTIDTEVGNNLAGIDRAMEEAKMCCHELKKH